MHLSSNTFEWEMLCLTRTPVYMGTNNVHPLATRSLSFFSHWPKKWMQMRTTRFSSVFSIDTLVWDQWIRKHWSHRISKTTRQVHLFRRSVMASTIFLSWQIYEKTVSGTSDNPRACTSWVCCALELMSGEMVDAVNSKKNFSLLRVILCVEQPQFSRCKNNCTEIKASEWAIPTYLGCITHNFSFTIDGYIIYSTCCWLLPCRVTVQISSLAPTRTTVLSWLPTATCDGCPISSFFNNELADLWGSTILNCCVCLKNISCKLDYSQLRNTGVAKPNMYLCGFLKMFLG